MRSGKGTLAINGNAGLGADAHTEITLKGSQFTAADIPSAKVVISPDLVIKQDARASTSAASSRWTRPTWTSPSCPARAPPRPRPTWW